MSDISAENLEHTVDELTSDRDYLSNHFSLASQVFQDASALVEQKGVWANATRLAEMLAGTLITESVRTSLGESGIIAHLVHLIKLSNDDQAAFRTQALRVLGNACFDHDDNRKRVADAEAVKLILPFLQEHQNPDLTKVACGFVLNSSMDYDPIQKAIGENGGIEYLARLLQPARMDHGEAMMVTFATKALDNLMGEDTCRNAYPIKCIPNLLTMITYEWQVDHLENLELLESLVDALLQLIAEDENVQNTVNDNSYFPVLLDFLENAELDDEEADEDDKKQFEQIQTSLSKIIVCATYSDSKMKDLYNNKPLLTRLLSWAGSESEVLAQCAIYVLGNLARTDEHCIDLVQIHHLEKTLLTAFGLSDKAIFQYAVLGCLKHLCLPKENKAIIGNANAIAILSPVLQSKNDMLKRNQFLTIGTIKLLCANEYNNAIRVINGELVNGEADKTPLDLILECIKRFDDPAAISEATRILTNLIKSVWFHEDAVASAASRQKLMKSSIIRAVSEMTRTSKFPVLKNDGLVALTLIFADSQSETGNEMLPEALSIVTGEPPEPVLPEESEEPNQQQQQPETRSFLEVLVELIGPSGKMPVEIRCNGCVLLEKIANAAAAVHDDTAYEKVKSASRNQVQHLAEEESSIITTVAQKTLAALEG